LSVEKLAEVYKEVKAFCLVVKVGIKWLAKD
jgi:hypothetical protein